MRTVEEIAQAVQEALAETPGLLDTPMSDVQRIETQVQTRSSQCGMDVGTRPSWMGVDQYDPCPCVRPRPHQPPCACACTSPEDAAEPGTETRHVITITTRWEKP